MSQFTPTSDGLPDLWRRAARRLRLVDPALPLEMAAVDEVMQALGPRHPGEALAGWLGRAGGEVAARPLAALVTFDPGRHRFVPLAGLTRLAADTGGPLLGLPERDLETGDGRFRLRTAKIDRDVEITLQALGQASDLFAGRLLGLSAGGVASLPFVLFKLDDDGDGTIRLADTQELRAALLQPVIGLVEDV